MIPLTEEPKDHFEELGVYEYCYFDCGNKTKFWYWKANQPVCIECSKKHKVGEIEKCTPDYRCNSKREYESNI